MGYVDTNAYVVEMAADISIEIENASQVDSVRSNLADRFALTYALPFHDLGKRDRFSLVRYIIARYKRGIVEYGGFIPYEKYLKNFAVSFMTSFIWHEKTVTYDHPQGWQDNPISPVLKRLKNQLDKDTYVTVETAEAISWCLTWLLFLSKLPMDRPSLTIPAETAWYEAQVRLASEQKGHPNTFVTNWETPLFYNMMSIIDPLKTIIDYLSDGYELLDAAGHGPGATRDGGRHKDTKNLAYDPTYQSNMVIGTHPREFNFHRIPKRAPDDSEWMAIFKDLFNVRCITLETVPQMLAQQAIKRSLYYQTDNKLMPMGLYTQYKDQRTSGMMALRGSGRSAKIGLSTIDLSHASDDISLDLIVQVFSGNLLSDLMAARTPGCVLPTYGHIELGMFAGMGSATTFPVQTMLFTAIAILAVARSVQKQHGLVDDYSASLADVTLPYGGFAMPDQHGNDRRVPLHHVIRCYGDDIIVPDFAVDEIFDLLSKLGFTVNKDKSFTGVSAFREACGIFACGGQNVTPLRNKVLPIEKGGLQDYARITSQRMLANASFLRKYKELNRFLLTKFDISTLFLQGDKPWRTFQKKDWRLFDDTGDPESTGFLSDRSFIGPYTEIGEAFGETAFVQLSLIPKVDNRDVTEDYYDLGQKSIRMSFSDRQMASSRVRYALRHGISPEDIPDVLLTQAFQEGGDYSKIPRGIRLEVGEYTRSLTAKGMEGWVIRQKPSHRRLPNQ
jgi:hypothetical protein